MSAGRIKISQMKKSDGHLRPEDLLHVVQMPHGENTKITIDGFRDYFSTLGYPRVWVTEGVPEESLGRDGDLCYATNPYPASPGPWFFGPKDARMYPGNPWGNGIPLNQGPPGEGRINDIFYESLQKMKDDYGITPGNNSMAAGPLDTNGKTINTNGGTLTVVGDEVLSPLYLNELADVQHALPSEVVDRYALIWHEEAQVWKPGPAPHGPKGEKGDPGDAGMMLNFLGVVPEEADLPGWPDKYTGSGGDAYDVTAKGQIYAWSSFFRIWQGVTTLHGPPGADGKPGADGNDGADSTVPGPQGEKGDKGEKGDGWIGGSYDSATGITTFNSDDGLTFSTTDIRGADGTNGIDGKGWKAEGTGYNENTGVVTFASDDGLGFETKDLRAPETASYASQAIAGTMSFDAARANVHGVTGDASLAIYRCNIINMARGQTVLIDLPAIPNGGGISVTANDSGVKWPEAQVPPLSTEGRNMVAVTYAVDFNASISPDHR
jgi:hypothetical protein